MLARYQLCAALAVHAEETVTSQQIEQAGLQDNVSVGRAQLLAAYVAAVVLRLVLDVITLLEVLDGCADGLCGFGTLEVGRCCKHMDRAKCVADGLWHAATLWDANLLIELISAIKQQ